MRKRAWAVIGFLAVVLVALPLLQFDTRNYMLQVLTFLLMNIVLAQSYDLVGGHLGYVNLGHIVFFAVGAYAFGIVYNAGLGLAGGLVVSTVCAVVFAALMAYPFFRLRGAYFSLASFGLVKLMEYITINLGWLTGGSNGLKIEPADRVVPVFYASLALVAAVLLTAWLIDRSRLGLAMKAIREDEEVALDCGVPTFRVKLQALMIAAAFPGLLGGLYTWYINFIDPGQVYGISVALTPIAMAMLGGSGLLVGPVIGATFLYVAKELIWTHVAYLHGALLGLVVVLVGLFMPGGLARLAPISRLLERIGLGEEDK